MFIPTLNPPANRSKNVSTRAGMCALKNDVLAADKIERRNIINCVGFFYIEQVFVVLAVARRAAVFVPLVIELDELERFLFAVPLQHALDILLGHYAV